MKQEITLSQAKLVAGAGLYDHLPGPIFTPPPVPTTSLMEKLRILEQLEGPQELMPNGGN